MGKIYIGECDKLNIIKEYTKKNDIDKIFVFGDDIDLDNIEIPTETIKFSSLIEYRYYYRLLQEVNIKTLIIINECLRRVNRYELTYNCIRHYLMNKPHRLIFNYLPIKEEARDFAILYDFNLDNPFLKDKYEWITDFSNVVVGEISVDLNVQEITIADEYCQQYEEEKEKVFNNVGKNVNSIPSKLLTFSEKVNKKYIKDFDSKRNFKPKMNIVVNQLKVDKYYYERLLKIKEQLNECLQKIHG